MTAEEIAEAIRKKPTMTVRIVVYSHYRITTHAIQDILLDTSFELPNGAYGEALRIAEEKKKQYGGRDASIVCDGWNQNYNVRYV